VHYCPECGRENADDARFCINCTRDLSPGGTTKLTLLQDRYEVLSIVKSGAMGCVYKARDTRLDNTVALKKMLSSHIKPEDMEYTEKRFREEAAFLSKLHHGGLPKVIDYFTEIEPDTSNPAHYLVMTFIEGRDLETIIAERNHSPFAVEEALDYFRKILDIFKYLHSQNPPVIYRDMNPRNIMIQKGQVFLVDFGIARIFNPQQKGTAIGTPGYASPEQYKGFAEPRSDLYSLGAVMHYLLTGIDPEDGSQTLFAFEPLRRLNPDVPEYLAGIIMSMVELVPDNRPSSAEAVERMLSTRNEKYGMKTSDSNRPQEKAGRAISFLGRARTLITAPKNLTLAIAAFSFIFVTALLFLIALIKTHNPMRSPESATSIPQNAAPAPDSLKCWYNLNSCQCNIKNLAAYLEMYSQDGDGHHYPPALSRLMPVYLKSLPTCPAAGFDTYSSTYRTSTLPDRFFLMCRGNYHSSAHIPADFPQYDSDEGVKPKFENIDYPASAKIDPNQIDPHLQSLNKSRQYYSSCCANLRNIATALEMYSTDNRGNYPSALSSLTPNYLRSIPPCPAAGFDTYSSKYSASNQPDQFLLMCGGKHHSPANIPDNFPQYSPFEGLKKR
jgi:serine/threonine protein kinase